MTPPDSALLRRAFGRWMTGVAVVTGRAPDGTPVGFTASSFTSVSLEPPLLLVCPGRHLSSFPVWQAADRFAVSVLAEGQEDVALTFARSRGDRFALVPTEPDALGTPMIAGRAAGFSCTVASRVEAGDHLLLIGAILAAEESGRRGLGVVSGSFFSLGAERQAEAPAPPERSGRAALILETEGGVILMTGAGALPATVQRPGEGARSALSALMDRLGIAARIGPVYAVWDEPGARVTVLRGRAEPPGPLLPVPLAGAATRPGLSPAEAAMLCRFAAEHQTRSFGLYLGDQAGGEVHRTEGP